MTRTTAADLVRQYPAEPIEAKLEVFDWLVEKQDKRVARSPAGYLVKSIADDYAVPKGFESRAARQARAEAKRQAEREAAEGRRREQEQEARDRASREEVDAYLKRLTPAERKALEAEVLAAADPEARQGYEEAPARYRGRLAAGPGAGARGAGAGTGADPRRMTPAKIRVVSSPNSGYSGRLARSPVGSATRASRRSRSQILAAFSACSRVSSPALSMIWNRSRTVMARDALAALRIITAAGMDFGSIFLDIVRLLDGIRRLILREASGTGNSGRATGGVRIVRPGHARSVRSPPLPSRGPADRRGCKPPARGAS